MEPPDDEPPPSAPSPPQVSDRANEKEARREAREQMARALAKFTNEGGPPGWWRFIKGRDLGRIVLLLAALLGVIFGARHCGQNASHLIEQLDGK